MAQQHRYSVSVDWTGNRGEGTSGYRAYDRAHRISSPGKPDLAGSSDPAFRGDAAAWNPEDLLVASLSACHMLWYLHLAAEAGIVVTAYRDDATGVMATDADGGGRFSSVTLHPSVTITDGDRVAEADALHADAHRLCFIARTVNFQLECVPVTSGG